MRGRLYEKNLSGAEAAGFNEAPHFHAGKASLPRLSGCWNPSFNEAPHFHAGKGSGLRRLRRARLLASMRPRTFMRGRATNGTKRAFLALTLQ